METTGSATCLEENPGLSKAEKSRLRWGTFPAAMPTANPAQF